MQKSKNDLGLLKTENDYRSDLQIDLMSELERGYFVMNLDEIDDQQLSQ